MPLRSLTPKRRRRPSGWLRPAAKFFNRSSAWVFERLYHDLRLSLLFIVAVIAIIYGLAASQHFEITHVVNVLSLVGLALTSIGFLYAYHQLQYANERIDSYEKFYRWVDEIFEDIREDGLTEFYFYGPTILPGNISFADDGPIKNFQNALTEIFSKTGDYSKVNHAVIITPPSEEYDGSYKFFETSCVRTLSNIFRGRRDDWLAFVRSKRSDAKEFQKVLTRSTFGEKIVPQSESRHHILSAYYVSNGHRIVFAKPLHYVNIETPGEDLDEHTTHLVGITSTDSATVNAFRDHFNALSGDSQRAMLRRMYDFHFRSPSYLDEELEGEKNRLGQMSPDEAVDFLAEYDHDNFGGKDATAACIRLCGILPGQTVLDIGSGFGGPTRYIAAKARCIVTGIEVQGDRLDWARQMTRHIGLTDNVSFVLGDASQIEAGRYNVVISLLSMLHFRNKEAFLANLGSRLHPGGVVFIDDYCRRKDLSRSERDLLIHTIACPELLNLEEYKRSLVLGGLTVDESSVYDMTDDWKDKALARNEKYQNPAFPIPDDPRGLERFRRARRFSAGVARLFQDEIIFGVRIVARKLIS